MFVLKAFSGIGGFVILLIGLAMLGVTIWAMMHAALVFDSYLLLGILMAADFVIIGAAILGICGIRRGSGFMICVFQIFVLLFFFVFLGLGIAAEVSPGKLFDGDCTSSENNKYIQLAYNSYIRAEVLCSPACPCSLSDGAISSQDYTAAERIALNTQALYNRSSSGAINYQQCKGAEDLGSNYTETFIILGSIENLLSCSGWCNNTIIPNPLIYKFSSVNDGKPAQACYETMKENTSKYSGIVGLTCIGVAAFMALVCICNLCICFSPDRREMKMKDRLVVRQGNYYRQA